MCLITKTEKAVDNAVDLGANTTVVVHPVEFFFD